jgi:uncharacterized membrane protein YkvA (DUF1232 family)
MAEESTPSDVYQAMRGRIRAWLERKGSAYKYADVLLVGPDLLHLLSKLAIDGRVPLAEKAKIAAAIAYFVSPFDLLPEALTGPAGYIDDIALAAYVLKSFLSTEHGNIAKEHWAGDQDLLAVVTRVLEVADAALGSGLWARLKRIADAASGRKGV